MSESLFDKYGGLETVSKLVHEFYKKVLADVELKPYFKDTDLDNLMQHQVKFLSFALGGPIEYLGRDLKVAHEPLNITKDHFGMVAEYLEEVLDEAGVEDSDVEVIMGIVGSVENQIVSSLKKSA